jgi:hypothetical protein
VRFHGLIIALVASACNQGLEVNSPFADGTGNGTSGDVETTTSGDVMTSDTTASDDPIPDADSGSSSTTDEGDDFGSFCGDGIVSGNEDCDCGGRACTEEDLGGHACTDVSSPAAPGVLTGGTLGCNTASCKWDVSGCTYCGDGVINGNEQCEDAEPIMVSCMGLGAGTGGRVGCGNACIFDVSDCTECNYTFDFSNCGGGWTTGRTDPAAANPSWACGDPEGAPPYGPPAGTTGVWATNLTSFHSANESSFVQSPPLDFSKCAGENLTLTLRHWHYFESQAGINADGGLVQVSGDGDEWLTLTPSSGTQYGTNPIVATFPPVDGSLGFDGAGASDNSAQMLESTFNLADYAGLADVHVRFVFGSNASSVTAGWYVDRIEILGGA